MKFRASVAFSPLRGLLIIIILALAFLIPGPVLAQDTQPVSVTNVRVDIWPEYDKPSVLVIYNVTLASTVTFPVTLSLRIPAAAGKPFAVAWESPDNTLYDIQYDLQTQGEWNTITFSTPSPNVRLEYYDPSLQKDGTKRDFTFRWPGDYTVDNLIAANSAAGQCHRDDLHPRRWQRPDRRRWSHLLHPGRREGPRGHHIRAGHVVHQGR